MDWQQNARDTGYGYKDGIMEVGLVIRQARVFTEISKRCSIYRLRNYRWIGNRMLEILGMDTRGFLKALYLRSNSAGIVGTIPSGC
jgi:hypothetical protein